MKKLLVLALVCSLLIGVLAPVLAEGVSGTVVVWDIWPIANDTNAIAWLKLLPEFEAAYPDIKIVRDPTENEAYKLKFAASQAAKTFPDVFFGWGPASARELVKDGLLLELSSYLDDDYMAEVNAGSLDGFTFDGGIYGLTMFQWTAALYCNTELFEANGVKIPETYDDLLTAIEQFVAAGIAPIGLPGQDPWTVAFFQHIMAIRFAGADAVNAMLKGERSFDDAAIIQSAQALLDLAAMGAFNEDALASTNDDIAVRFMMGEFPMYFMGNWYVGQVTGEDSLVADKVVAINFPAVGAGFDDQVLGAATDGFMINANSENVEAAVTFVKWMTAHMPEQCYAAAGAIPTRSNFDMAAYDVPSVSADIAAYTALASGSTFAWDTFLPKEPTDLMLKMLQQLVGQLITAEDFAKGLADVIEATGYAQYK